MDLIIYDEALVCVALITQRKAESSAFFFLIGEIFCFGGGLINWKGQSPFRNNLRNCLLIPDVFLSEFFYQFFFFVFYSHEGINCDNNIAQQEAYVWN